MAVNDMSGARALHIVAVVPAWNARARLPAVLGALAGQVAAVVVVDNDSTDGTGAWLAGGPPLGVPLTLLTSPFNRGYAAAVNRGMDHALAADAEAVLLVNDDAVFAPGSVARLAAALRAGTPRESGEPGGAVGAATAHMVYAGRPGALNGAGGVVRLDRAWAALRGSGEVDDGRYADQPAVDYPSGAACLLARGALEAVGRLDEAWYLYYEDVDWGLRARKAGWRTVYVPEARVVHAGSAGTAADPARRRYYNVRNRLRFARRHCRRRGRLWAWGATSWLVAQQPLRWLFPSRRRDAEAVLRGVGDYLAGRSGRSGWCG